jgi:hypothetical protein
MPFDLTSNSNFLKNISIYENEKQYYFIGTHNSKKTLLIFTMKKLRFMTNKPQDYDLKDILVEHKREYNKKSFEELNSQLSQNPSTQLRFVDECKAIFGFVKFYYGYYAILVTDFSKIGKIGDYVINRVEKTKMLALFLVSQNNAFLDTENRYLTTFKKFELSRQTYFSFTYNLTKTLQRNFVENIKSELLKNYKVNFYKDPKSKNEDYIKDEIHINTESSDGRRPGSISIDNSRDHHSENSNNRIQYDIKKVTNNTFLWNHFHIKELFDVLENKIWVTFFIYGFFEQVECSIYGLRFLITVIARRNREYAGTRYLKRGICDDGNVANDVETEQILEEISTSCPEKPIISSYIHIRGSVPIYWYQEHVAFIPKPTIRVNYSDVFFETTKRHFSLLTKRYGGPLIVCNLTKQHDEPKQESLLNETYLDAVEYINEGLGDKNKIIYCHYDLKQERRKVKFYRQFYEISYALIEKTNMFSFMPHLRNSNTYILVLQSGAIRSNCIDCLDRTNVFQQVIGTAVMVNQVNIIF